MRLIKWLSPRFDTQTTSGVGQRQCWATLILAALALAGCGQTSPEGEVGRVSGFFGGVATDEPNAALIARDTLSAGGNAADAAVAAYFALAVTYPNAAGLGGGGVCVLYDRAADKLESLEFLPGTTASSPSARRAQADPSLMDRARDVGEKIGDWWDELLKPPPGPGDEIVRCRVAGNTQFTRRDECTARGGRAS